MSKALEEALAEVAALPEGDQETIARELLVHVEKRRRLRNDLERGTRSLDAGLGREVSMTEIIKRSRDTHGSR